MTTQPTEATMTDAELDALVARLNGCATHERSLGRTQTRVDNAVAFDEAAAALTTLRKQRDELRDHIFGHAEFAEYRIKDGSEMGANVWRLALEDIAKENRQALSNMEGE